MIDRSKLIKGKQFEKELRSNITATEKQFKKLVGQAKKKYKLKFKMNFQKGWYKDSAFFISDFYFPESNTTIELDGKSHNKKKQKEQDSRKEAYLKSIGVKTVRIQNNELWNMDCDSLVNFLVSKRII